MTLIKKSHPSNAPIFYAGDTVGDRSLFCCGAIDWHAAANRQWNWRSALPQGHHLSGVASADRMDLLRSGVSVSYCTWTRKNFWGPAGVKI
jgi:hypothetical protein